MQPDQKKHKKLPATAVSGSRTAEKYRCFAVLGAEKSEKFVFFAFYNVYWG